MDEPAALLQLRRGTATPEIQQWAVQKIEQLIARKAPPLQDVWERPFANGHGYNE
jgi:hypothetical protein